MNHPNRNPYGFINPIITNPNTGEQQTALLKVLVEPLFDKNPLRNSEVEGNNLSIRDRNAAYGAANPILGFSNILDYLDMGNVSKDIILFNLMCDKTGNFLASREILYTCKTGKQLRSPKDMIAQDYLNDLKKEQVLSKVTDYRKKAGISREATVKLRMKGITDSLVDLILYILDTDPALLMIHSHTAFIANNNPNLRNFHYEKFSVRQNQLGQLIQDLQAVDGSCKDQMIQYQSAIGYYKYWQANHGITVSLLVTMIREFIPGDQPGRKNKILDILIKHYGLDSSSAPFDKIPPIKPIEPNQGLLVRSLTMAPEPKPMVPPDTIEELKQPLRVPVSPREKKVEEVKGDSIKETTFNQVLPTKSGRELTVIHAYPVGVKPIERKAQKYAAVKCITHKLQPWVDQFNHHIRNNLRDYQDKDMIDTRQRARMFKETSPLPLSYADKSINSPRVYSEQPDNLFACRKDMRKAALKGLGAVDVDMKSCHTYILMAKWPEQLPLLREAMDKGTLWDMYEVHYKSLGLPFMKKAVKAMHYASVLGGGDKAFKDAIHRSNLDNPEQPISNVEEMIKAHKKSPIYKELKKLLSHITKEWEGKLLKLPTGEQFKVKGFRQHKDNGTGQLIKKPGNILTALSAYLQSYEVMLMSHLILHTKELYIPLIWQHDGLTIIPRTEHYLTLMQEVLDQATQYWLGQGSLIGDATNSSAMSLIELEVTALEEDSRETHPG